MWSRAFLQEMLAKKQMEKKLNKLFVDSRAWEHMEKNIKKTMKKESVTFTNVENIKHLVGTEDHIVYT